MADQTESAASFLAKKDYAHALPLLKTDLDKYPSNPRIRLQYADALAGSGSLDQAIEQYEATASYYDDNGLTVQAIAVAATDGTRIYTGSDDGELWMSTNNGAAWTRIDSGERVASGRPSRPTPTTQTTRRS